MPSVNYIGFVCFTYDAAKQAENIVIGKATNTARNLLMPTNTTKNNTPNMGNRTSTDVTFGDT